jgi:hypothetical protein
MIYLFSLFILGAVASAISPTEQPSAKPISYYESYPPNPADSYENYSVLDHLGLGNIHVVLEDVIMSGLLGIMVALVGIVIILQRQRDPEVERDRRLLDISARDNLSINESIHSTSSVAPKTRIPKRISVSIEKRPSLEISKQNRRLEDDGADEEGNDSDSSDDEADKQIASTSPLNKEIRILKNVRATTPRRQGWATDAAFLEGSVPPASIDSTFNRWDDINQDTKIDNLFPLSTGGGGGGNSMNSGISLESRIFKSPARARPTSTTSTDSVLKFSDTVAAAAAAVNEYTTDLPSFASLSMARGNSLRDNNSNENIIFDSTSSGNISPPERKSVRDLAAKFT